MFSMDYRATTYEVAISRTPVGPGGTHQPSGAFAEAPPMFMSSPSPSPLSSPSSTMSSDRG